jgi:carbon-monoxide dehydrogenase medium subunit
MYDFEFLSPHSVAEAVAMLRDHEVSKLLAGGQTFIPVLKQRLSRPSHVIDLSGVGLAGISFQSDRIVIGAMTTHATVAAHAVICERIPGISRLASWIGDRFAIVAQLADRSRTTIRRHAIRPRCSR